MRGEAGIKNRDVKRLVRALITGTISGAAVSFLLIFISVFAVTKSGTVPYAAIPPLVIAAEGIGTFFGGFLTSKINRRMGMAFGAVCGVVLFFVYIISGAASGSTIGISTLLRLLLCVVSGAFGGVAGVQAVR